MSPEWQENRKTLIRFSENMEVMVATLNILDKSTRGELSGPEAMEQLNIIKEKFYTSS